MVIINIFTSISTIRTHGYSTSFVRTTLVIVELIVVLYIPHPTHLIVLRCSPNPSYLACLHESFFLLNVFAQFDYLIILSSYFIILIIFISILLPFPGIRSPGNLM
jgi:hypothetical protein